LIINRDHEPHGTKITSLKYDYVLNSVDNLPAVQRNVVANAKRLNIPNSCRNMIAAGKSSIVYVIQTDARNISRYIDTVSSQMVLLRGHEKQIRDVKISIDKSIVCSCTDLDTIVFHIHNVTMEVKILQKFPIPAAMLKCSPINGKTFVLVKDTLLTVITENASSEWISTHRVIDSEVLGKRLCLSCYKDGLF
jgi:hypothetical protein